MLESSITIPGSGTFNTDCQVNGTGEFSLSQFFSGSKNCYSVANGCSTKGTKKDILLIPDSLDIHDYGCLIPFFNFHTIFLLTKHGRVKLTSIKDLQCIDKASLSLTIPHDLVSIIIQDKFSKTYALHFSYINQFNTPSLDWVVPNESHLLSPFLFRGGISAASTIDNTPKIR